MPFPFYSTSDILFLGGLIEPRGDDITGPQCPVLLLNSEITTL